MLLQEDTGLLYMEAIDPVDGIHSYTESDTLIPVLDEATEEDYKTALIEMGVELHEEE